MIKSYRDLNVWKDAMNLVEVTYKLSSNFPNEERFGLTNQIRRCAVSIPSNIAEGAMRQYLKEYIHFLYIALGSLGELDTQLTIAYRLIYFSEEEFNLLQNHIITVRKQVISLIKALKNKL
ncbi:four helix bundle protein [Riemerella columbina]|uniref:four helix bundle protein n=1 Tax=Riemerella columbina TaxID=103810 RepID=UPI00035D3070|nr:four helix bundle protein [Riemerella columbina]